MMAACGDDDGGGSTTADAAADPTSDAATQDASGVCPGETQFTGEYIDWDSTPISFMGIVDADVTEVGDASNAVKTAPNGRAIMCLKSDAPSRVDFSAAGYIDLRYTAAPEAFAAGPFSIRGLTTQRSDDLFAQIAVTRNDQRTQLLVDVYDHGADGPAVGAKLSIGNTNDDGFINDGTGKYVSGADITSDRLVLFTNVELGTGTTSITITPPAGKTCVGPTEVELVVGQMVATSFSCRDQ